MSDFDLAMQKIGLTSNTVSCGYCNATHYLENLIKKESKLDNERYYYRLEYICPESKKTILGADVGADG